MSEAANNAAPVAPVTDEPPYPSERYAWYVVFILMVVYVFSFIDRQILALLVGPIRADLNISDTEMSYLMGISFAVFYAIFGIPLGRLADSRSRRAIIAAGLAGWSLMTAACGLTSTYLQLLLARIGVGIGEATLSPSAYSLITDYFRANRLAIALSVYGAGIYIGSGMAYLLGGVVINYTSAGAVTVVPIVGEIRPWQLVFFMIGIPGLAFTAALLTIKEPLRRGLSRGRERGASLPIGEVVGYIKANWKTFGCHSLGFSMLAVIGYGSAAWVPTMFIRVHGWTPAEVGLRYGLAIMLFGTAGILFGGFLAERLALRGYSDSKMRAGLIAAVAFAPFGAVFPILSDGWWAFVVLCPATFCLAMPFGVAPAAIQEMMPNRMRGQASAIYIFIVNILGLGVGPTAIAWCTDSVFQDDAKVNYSLLVVGLVAGTLAVVLLFTGLKQFRRSLLHRDEWHAR